MRVKYRWVRISPNFTSSHHFFRLRLRDSSAIVAPLRRSSPLPAAPCRNRSRVVAFARAVTSAPQTPRLPNPDDSCITRGEHSDVRQRAHWKPSRSRQHPSGRHSHTRRRTHHPPSFSAQAAPIQEQELAAHPELANSGRMNTGLHMTRASALLLPFAMLVSACEPQWCAGVKEGDSIAAFNASAGAQCVSSVWSPQALLSYATARSKSC